jgi:hypothetical protein
VAGDAEAALWAIAASLDLNGTYTALYQQGDETAMRLFTTHVAQNRTRRIYNMVKGLNRPWSANGELRKIQNIPVKLQWSSGKQRTVRSLLDLLIHNVKHGFRWFAGIHDAFLLTRTLESGRDILGLAPYELKAIENLIQGDDEMNLIEIEIGRKFRLMFTAIAIKYKEQGAESPWEKADRFVIRTCLNRGVNSGSLLEAYRNIKMEAETGKANLSSEETAYFMNWARTNPMELRGFLSMACATEWSKTTEQMVKDRLARKLAKANSNDAPSDTPDTSDPNDDDDFSDIPND